MQLDGPQSALLVQGDDRMGALAEIHEIDIEADETTVALLLEEPKEYAPAAVTIDGTEFADSSLEDIVRGVVTDMTALFVSTSMIS